MERVPDENLEYADNGLYYLNGVPFTGVAYTLYDDGRLESEVEIQNGLVGRVGSGIIFPNSSNVAGAVVTSEPHPSIHGIRRAVKNGAGWRQTKSVGTSDH